MSNEIGDLYACSDPSCGCEVEIERPCSSVPSETSSSVERTSGADMFDESHNPRVGYEHRSESTSTPGDYGSQGVTGEGTFGTSGTGDPNALGSGRYDTEVMRVPRTERLSKTQSARSFGAMKTLTCFCGSQMRQVDSRQSSARGARAGL
jgi:hypothetical protein